MKINRKYKVNTASDSFSLPLLLSKPDIVRVMKSDTLSYFKEDVLPRQSWEELLGRLLTTYSTELRVMSIWHDVGIWATSLAEREGLLVHDVGEPDLLLFNVKKLDSIKTGPVKADDEG